jgi:hypothetical protein
VLADVTGFTVNRATLRSRALLQALSIDVAVQPRPAVMLTPTLERRGMSASSSGGRSRGGARQARMSLLADLEEFVRDHRPHGAPTGDATAWNSYLLTVTCPCSVVFERLVTPEDAELDLLEAAFLN